MKATAQMVGLTREEIADLRECNRDGEPVVYLNTPEKMRALCDLALQAIDRWVPVSERLPEEGIEVLAVWTEKGAADYNDTVPHDDVRAGIDVVGSYYVRAHVFEGWFSHWMPLPPPPERP